MSRLGRWVPVLAVLAVIGAAMFATLYADLEFRPRALPAPPRGEEPVFPSVGLTPQPLPSGEAEGDVPEAMLPDWVGTLLAGLCLGGLVVVLVLLLWQAVSDRLMSRRSAPEITDPQHLRRHVQEQVRAAVDEGLADLDIGDRDARRAVIACWARLELAAAAAGTPRAPGDTSTDLVQRLLAEHAVTGSVLAAFASVYREARFATHVVDPAMREEARSALRQVRDELISDADPAPAVGPPTPVARS